MVWVAAGYQLDRHVGVGATLPAGKIRSAYAVAETDVIRCGACASMVDPSLNGVGARSRLRQLRISENMVKWSEGGVLDRSHPDRRYRRLSTVRMNRHGGTGCRRRACDVRRLGPARRRSWPYS